MGKYRLQRDWGKVSARCTVRKKGVGAIGRMVSFLWVYSFNKRPFVT